MKWLNKICILTLLLPLNALAAIDDPQGILRQSDAFLGSPDFSHAFHTGDHWTGTQIDCVGTSGPCDTMHLNGRIEIEESNGSRSAVITYGPQSIERLTETQWQKALGNSLRMQMEGLSAYGHKVQLTSAQTLQSTLNINGSVQKMTLLRVSFGAQTVGTQIHGEIDLAAHVGGAVQIIRYEEKRSGFLSSHRLKVITAIAGVLESMSSRLLSSIDLRK